VTKQGCTICVKECPFSKKNYEDIYKRMRLIKKKEDQ
jgi:ferredoxin